MRRDVIMAKQSIMFSDENKTLQFIKDTKLSAIILIYSDNKYIE